MPSADRTIVYPLETGAENFAGRHWPDAGTPRIPNWVYTDPEVFAREHGHHWTTIGVSGYGPWLISTSRSLIRCSRRGCRRHQRTYFRTSRS